MKIFNTFILITAVFVSACCPCVSWAQEELYLPSPGVLVPLSQPFNPPILKGIRVHADHPWQLDFVVDKGGRKLSEEQLKSESIKLVKYFLTSVTVPEDDLWVNLSPYEKNRIIPNLFGLTEMGRDLLAEDYMLKQITASLIYPENNVGRKFWERVYTQARQRFGTTNLPINTFNKVWIVPQKAVLYENAKTNAVYISESRLKVMLDQDYLSLRKHVSGLSLDGKTSDISAQIVREIVIPELDREVNQGMNFMPLRQVYNSLILAAWYKRRMKESILAQVYEDKNKIRGIEYQHSMIEPKQENHPVNDVDLIYQRYLQAFKKGVFNYIKEDFDPNSKETFARKYFSGGECFSARYLDKAMVIEPPGQMPTLGDDQLVTVDVQPADVNGPGQTHDVNLTQGRLPQLYFGSIEGNLAPLFNPQVALYNTVSQAELPADDSNVQDLIRRKTLQVSNGDVYLPYPIRRPKGLQGEVYSGLWGHLTGSLIDDVFRQVVEQKYHISPNILETMDKSTTKANPQEKRIITYFRSSLSEFKKVGGSTRQLKMGFVISALLGEQGLDDYSNVFIPRDMGYGYSSQSGLDRFVDHPRPPPGTFYISRKSLGEDYFIAIKEMILRSTTAGAAAYFLMDRYKNAIDQEPWTDEEKQEMKDLIDSKEFVLIMVNTISRQYANFKEQSQNREQDAYQRLIDFVKSKQFITEIQESMRKTGAVPEEKLTELFDRVEMLNQLVLKKNKIVQLQASRKLFASLSATNPPYSYSAQEFKDGLDPKGLITALQKAGVKVPRGYSPVARLNKVLSQRLEVILPERTPEIDYLIENQKTAVDRIRLNRLLIEATFLKEGPKRRTIVTMLRDDIQTKMQEDPDFRQKIDEIVQNLMAMGYDKQLKVRFIDSGQGTFPLLLQAIFALKFPHVETQGLALAARYKDLLSVYDTNRWREGLVALAYDQLGPGLKNILERPSASIEAENFLPHPVKWEQLEDGKEGLVEDESPESQIATDWTIINFVAGARAYYQMLQKIMERQSLLQQKPVSIEEAAKLIRQKLSPDIFYDPSDPKNYTDPTHQPEGPAGSDHSSPKGKPPKAPGAKISPRSVKAILTAILWALTLSLPEKIASERNSTPRALPPPRPATKSRPTSHPVKPANKGSLSGYTVQPGDTLSNLSWDIFGNGGYVHYIRIFRNNHYLPSPNRIYPGNKLLIQNAKFEKYTIGIHDTLQIIATNYYGNPQEAHRITHFNRGKIFKPGMRIVIPMSVEEWDAWRQRPKGSKAMQRNTTAKGGIDFNTDKLDLQTEGKKGEKIHFHIDPLFLQKLQNAPGFVPVIVNIQPLFDLHAFLSVSPGTPRAESALH